MVGDDRDDAYTGVSVLVGPDAMVTCFADLIQVEASPEYVSINVLQKVPGACRDTEREGSAQATLVSRVAMTWPHFVRLADLLPRIVDDYRDRARQAFEGALR